MDAVKVAEPAAMPSSSNNPTRTYSPRKRYHKPKGNQKESKDPEPQAGVQNNANRVKVFGYSQYTQPQDLVRAFTKFGSVEVDKINNRFAVLSFSSETESTEALKASKKVQVYGKYLTIERHTGGVEIKHHAPKRDFSRSKQKGIITDPKNIDLTGDFHEQLDKILAAVRLTQENVALLGSLYSDLEAALQTQWPGCTAIPFGSITTGLGIKTSDADCFICIPPQFMSPYVNFVNKAKHVLQMYPKIFAEILSIPQANTPIVKFFHIPTETNCDVTFKTPLGAQNSKLIAFLLHADPRLIPMSVVIKYWAKVHEFSGTGKLTNYALTMLIIFYLQQPPMSILPSVACLQRDPATQIIVDYWNTGFMSQRQLPPSSNTSSISELIGGFFEYYSMFNFEEMVVCPYLGVPIKKTMFADLNLLPNEFELYKENVSNNYAMPIRVNTAMCVQDPFEQCHNVASGVSQRRASDIVAYFKFAANAYEKGKLNNCEDLFTTILLQKPKIIKSRTNPEYRVNMFPRIITNIASPDWKSVVREIIFTIFENMLLIKLGKVEEKVNPDSKKEKEKYMGTLTRAIWKRKNLTKLSNNMQKMSFQQKQEWITREILNTDKQEINVQIQLMVTYSHDPKCAVISIRLSTGDVEIFREFGKFFISKMQDWFTQLLRPHTRVQENDMAAKIAETKMSENHVNVKKYPDSDDDSLSSPNANADVNKCDESAIKIPDDECPIEAGNHSSDVSTSAPETH